MRQLLFIVFALGACGGVTAPDAGVDAAADVASSCSPGTCRLSADSTGPCLPPGGPIGEPDSGTLSGCCSCGSDGLCSSPCVCASPDTPIATPSGDRPIASLAVGDVVLSVDHGELAAVPIVATRRVPVEHHRVIEVRLEDGDVLHISAMHPTADGRTFGDLREGDYLGDRRVASARVVPYAHDATYDILPASDSETYFAAGALIGSTLAHPRATQACFGLGR
jgi:hypothetical protein